MTQQRSTFASILARALTAMAAVTLTGACMSTGEEGPPPEREFDQSTAWERLEGAAAEAITDLPDFPGFHERTMQILECSHGGEVNEEYVNLELSYSFDIETSTTELVRETYLSAFRDKWGAAGYDIHRDTKTAGDPPAYALEARRTDGVNLWYRVAGLAVLKVQSGCVKAVEGGEFTPDCPTPLGGVTRENDLAAKYCSNGGTVYPGEDETSIETVSPFEESESASPTGMVPWAREPDPAEAGPNPYADQL